MVKTVYDRINEELKRQKITKKEVAERLGYKNTSGFTNAVKRGTLRLNDFIEIAYMLGVRPIDLFPNEIKISIYEMSIYEFIESIVLMALEKHVEKDHKQLNEANEKFREFILNTKSGGG